MQEELLDFLKKHDVKYKEKIKLSTISPIRIGGEAEIVAYPSSEEKLVKLSMLLQKLKIKNKITGRMSNLLPPDDNYHGVIVRTDLLCSCKTNGNILTAASGASITGCAYILSNLGLSGFEGLSGIPGSIGGALVGNAGAFGYEISDRLSSVRALDLHTGEINSLSLDACGFGYRKSGLSSDNYVILSAEFVLSYSCKEDVFSKMEGYRMARIKTQPREPSLGSTFKRPAENIYASRLIDECGLKGYRVGGAEISKKHAGFIINCGGASAKDYIELAKFAQKCVNEKYKISLLPEVEILR